MIYSKLQSINAPDATDSVFIFETLEATMKRKHLFFSRPQKVKKKTRSWISLRFCFSPMSFFLLRPVFELVRSSSQVDTQTKLSKFIGEKQQKIKSLDSFQMSHSLLAGDRRLGWYVSSIAMVSVSSTLALLVLLPCLTTWSSSSSSVMVVLAANESSTALNVYGEPLKQCSQVSLSFCRRSSS